MLIATGAPSDHPAGKKASEELHDPESHMRVSIALAWAEGPRAGEFWTLISDQHTAVDEDIVPPSIA